MGRASGKKTPRQMLEDLLGSDAGGALEGLPQAGRGAEQSAGVRAEEGIGAPRDIPGGKNHIANPVTPNAYRDPPPVPEREWPYRRALLAHGVDPDGQHADRDPRLTNPGSRARRPKLDELTPRVTPVPVFIVEQTGGAETIRAAVPRSVTCPASTSAEPIRVAGLNPRRVRIGLLNEDTSTDIRFSSDLSNLSSGTGALLPWPNNSYVWFETQAEIFAIGATGGGTPRLSVIEEYQESAAT